MRESILGKKFRELRFMQLFVFSLIVMLMEALFHQSTLITLITGLLYLNAMLVTLSASGARKLLKPVLITLWICAVIIRLLPSPADYATALFVVSEALIAALFMVCIVSIIHYIQHSQRVTEDALFAAAVAYILIALVFAHIYAITEHLLPGSFIYPPELQNQYGFLSNVRFYYFSFVTIATLGYGDIVPRHPLPQILASIEAVIGQFYVAVGVAWLVGLYINHNKRK